MSEGNGRAPIFCEKLCPVCKRARRGVEWAAKMQAKALEKDPLGCRFGKARYEYYGVRPNENVPTDWKPK